jgi:hypothetical protein
MGLLTLAPVRRRCFELFYHGPGPTRGERAPFAPPTRT